MEIEGDGRSCKTIIIALFLSLAALNVGNQAYGQVSTATLSGTVFDTAGALVPNATITLKDESSVYTRKLTSNAQGYFSFAAVPSSSYSLTIKANGFKGFEVDHIHLDPGDSRALNDIHLEIGSVDQTVNVTATTSGIPLDSGTLTTTISSEQINKLSVEGRDITELMKILPGFAINNQGASNSTYDPSIVTPGGATLNGSYISNGTGRESFTARLDGGDITIPGGYQSLTVNYDMISETQVLTSNFGADSSNGPTVMNSVTKAGTTEFHGSIYTYARTYQLDSFDWLANFLNQAKAPDRYIYPGATFGGPILIPGTSFNRTKKLTFFVGGEDYAQRNAFAYGTAASALVHALVPTAAMRQGDFSAAQLSQYLGPNYGSSSYNNVTNVPTTAINGTPIVNGQLSSGYIDPGGKALVNLMPLPNVPSNIGGFNYVTQNLVNNDLWQSIVRIDLAKSEKTHLFGRYGVERGVNGVPQAEYYSPSGPMGGFNTPGGLSQTTNNQSAAVNLTNQLGRNLTNELFGSFIYAYAGFQANQPSLLTAAGANYPYNGAYANGSKGYPQFQDYGNDGLPIALFPDFTLGPLFGRNLNVATGDNLNKVWGTHTVEGGGYVQRVSVGQQFSPSTTNGAINLYYESFPTFTDIDGTVHHTSENYLANLMEGVVDAYQQQNILPTATIHYWNIDGYIEDTWKIAPTLTVNYGIRLEHLSMYTPSNNLGIAVFDPNQINNAALPLPGFVWHAVDSSIPLSGVSSKPLFYEPRVGFAWDVYGNGKTVVRGGYGAYRTHDSNNDIIDAAFTPQGLNGINVGNGGVTLAAVSKLNLPANSGTNNGTLFALTKGDNQAPQTKNYSLSVDQQLPHNFMLQMSYVGNNSNYIFNGAGQSEIGLDNINAIPMGALYKPNPVTGAPAKPISGTDSIANMSATEINDYRPYPNGGNYGYLSVPKHSSYSNYNGLQVVLQNHSGPLLLGVNYTYSKALGLLGSDFAIYEGSQLSALDPHANYGPMPFDRTHIFNATYAYTFGSYVHSRLAGAFVNNWMLSGITNVQGGANMQTSISSQPNFTLQGKVGANGDPNQINVENSVFLGTPDVSLQPVLVCDPRTGLGAHQYVNGACFKLPNIGQNGQNIFPYMHGPAFLNSDLTAQKSFSLGESKVLQFRAAAFNFLNHPLQSFTSSFSNQYTLNLSNLSSFNTGSAVYQPSSGFGYAPYKVGRRMVELSAKFSF